MNESIFHILISVSREELSTKAIREHISELTGGERPPVTTLYRALAAAEEHGWIEVVQEQTGTGGRPAQTYRITAEGKRAVRARARELRALSDLVLAAERRTDGSS